VSEPNDAVGLGRPSAPRAAKTPDRVARQVLDKIRQRNLVPGDRLPNEVSMAQEFGVGRASVREALRILETQGLVQIRPGPRGGPVVRAADGVDFGRSMSMFFSQRGATYREVIEARLAIEPLQARLAAERLTDDSAKSLQEAAESGWQMLDASDQEWADSSRAVHRAIAQASGNRVLDLALGGLLAMEASYLSHTVKREFRPHTLHAHDKLVAAIVARDADRAAELAHAHIQALVRDIARAYPNEMDHVIEWLNFD